MKKRLNVIKDRKLFSNFSVNSLVMITRQQIRINCIKEINIKSDAKKMKYLQISKKFL